MDDDQKILLVVPQKYTEENEPCYPCCYRKILTAVPATDHRPMGMVANADIDIPTSSRYGC